MKSLNSILNEKFLGIILNHKDGDEFRNSNIKDYIKRNDALVYEIIRLLSDEHNLKLTKKLMKCNSAESILELHLNQDKIAGNHEIRVGDYAEGLAKYVNGMNPEIMKIGGLVHDIGKSFIPKEILYSLSFKNPLEMELVTYGHTLVGEVLTLVVDVLNDQPIADMVSCHHDGKDGYPHRIMNLKDEVEALKVVDEYDLQSPDYADALKVVDTAHAMQRGGYQPVYSDEEIFRYLINHSKKDGKFNPVYVDAFLKFKKLTDGDIMGMRE